MQMPNTTETLSSPLEIEVLLHCYYCPKKHPRMHCDPVHDAHEKLKRLGAIDWMGDEDDRYLGATQLGRAWVKALKRVPIPRLAYLDQAGNILQVVE